jgi:hypothetical protein
LQDVGNGALREKYKEVVWTEFSLRIKVHHLQVKAQNAHLGHLSALSVLVPGHPLPEEDAFLFCIPKKTLPLSKARDGGLVSGNTLPSSANTHRTSWGFLEL